MCFRQIQCELRTSGNEERKRVKLFQKLNIRTRIVRVEMVQSGRKSSLETVGKQNESVDGLLIRTADV